MVTAKDWKDTVIKNEDIMELEIPCETCKLGDFLHRFHTRECMECMALKHREAQAEITWDKAYKAGIREVVEWGNGICMEHTHLVDRWVRKRECDSCWQAKLKEWEGMKK